MSRAHGLKVGRLWLYWGSTVYTYSRTRFRRGGRYNRFVEFVSKRGPYVGASIISR